MLERPEIEDERIIEHLQAEYWLSAAQVAFLPLGADLGTAVYRVTGEGGRLYFLKLRRDTAFDETSVALPSDLHQQGVPHLIAPIPTQSGQLWGKLDTFKIILYPFVEGCDGYEADLSDRQWCGLGAVVRRLHTASLPPALLGSLRRETYSTQWRDIVRDYVGRVGHQAWADPIAAETAAFLMARQAEVLALVEQAEWLAGRLRAGTADRVVCHADLHAGNLLLGPGGEWYLIDWDTAMLAPKERDLMFIGGGLMGNKRTPEEEEALFYRGYGPTQVDLRALAYYRCERITEDIAVECQQIFSTAEGGDDRAQALDYLKANFLPNQTIDLALRIPTGASPKGLV